MDNNRNRRATNFENDLQNLFSDYLTRNLNNMFNNNEDTSENNDDNTEHFFNIYRQNHNSNPSYNTSFSENRYLRTINHIVDNMDRTITNYQNNMTLYLNTMNRMINIIHNHEINRNRFRNTTNVPYRNLTSNTFNNNIHRTNPLRPSQNIHTNVAQPARYNNIFAYTLPTNHNDLFGTNTEGLFSNLFQNVIVRPSQAQIDEASEHIVYDMSMNLINQRCPITLEEFESGDRLVRLTYCGHTFTESSFTNWFQSNVRCPVCRHDIRENNESQNTTENEGIDNEEIDNNTNPSLNTADSSMNTNLHLFSDNSNINLFDLINTNIQTLFDPSSNIGFRLEIPFHYSEIYDISDNFIGRTFP